MFIMFFDFLFYIMWMISGQSPVDSFYFGSISAHLIDLI